MYECVVRNTLQRIMGPPTPIRGETGLPTNPILCSSAYLFHQKYAKDLKQTIYTIYFHDESGLICVVLKVLGKVKGGTYRWTYS